MLTTRQATALAALLVLTLAGCGQPAANNAVAATNTTSTSTTTTTATNTAAIAPVSPPPDATNAATDTAASEPPPVTDQTTGSTTCEPLFARVEACAVRLQGTNPQLSERLRGRATQMRGELSRMDNAEAQAEMCESLTSDFDSGAAQAGC
jgi:hypothetical protein